MNQNQYEITHNNRIQLGLAIPLRSIARGYADRSTTDEERGAMSNETESTGATADATGHEAALQSLAFISLVELEKDVFRGGVLVTDAQGKPLEFRCTSAIQPTAVQKTLYGGTLNAHMAVELTARPLLNAVKQEYDAVFVTQDDFIELRKAIKPLRRSGRAQRWQESRRTDQKRASREPLRKVRPCRLDVPLATRGRHRSDVAQPRCALFPVRPD